MREDEGKMKLDAGYRGRKKRFWSTIVSGENELNNCFLLVFERNRRIVGAMGVGPA